MAIFAWLSPTNAEPESRSRMSLNTKQRNNHLMKPDLSRNGAESPNYKSPRTVYFEANAPDAKSVCIAATFNFWHPAATKMVRLEGGRWGKRLTLPPGDYEYRFVMDNEWKADPNCHQSVPNPYGGMNSLFTIAEVSVSSSKKPAFSRPALKPAFGTSLPCHSEKLERSHL
jgi:1,4-alpha-glucan branching enzyme